MLLSPVVTSRHTFSFCLFKVPPIDSSSTDGIEIEQSAFKGNINFNNIEFIYPSRPDVKVKGILLTSFL